VSLYDHLNISEALLLKLFVVAHCQCWNVRLPFTRLSNFVVMVIHMYFWGVLQINISCVLSWMMIFYKFHDGHLKPDDFVLTWQQCAIYSNVLCWMTIFTSFTTVIWYVMILLNRQHRKYLPNSFLELIEMCKKSYVLLNVFFNFLGMMKSLISEDWTCDVKYLFWSFAQVHLCWCNELYFEFILPLWIRFCIALS
jgi:hypothetical protein